VTDELASLCTRRAKPHAVNHIIEAAFEELQQRLPSITFATLGLGKIAAELALKHTVGAFDLLLFTQLLTVIRGSRPRGAAMLAWAGVELTLRIERATGTLQEEIRTFAPR
jgi:hypothetical protein